MPGEDVVRRHASYGQVAQDSPAAGRGETQHQNPEGVGLLPDRSDGFTDGGDEDCTSIVYFQE